MVNNLLADADSEKEDPGTPRGIDLAPSYLLDLSLILFPGMIETKGVEWI